MDRESLFNEFVSEARDLIDSAETALLELEKELEKDGKASSDTINKTFRYFHTLKGSSGLLKLETVVRITHVAETLLDVVRNQTTVTEFPFGNDLLETLDLLRTIFDSVEERHSDSGFESEAEGIRSLLQSRLDEISNNGKKEAAPVSDSSAEKFGFFEENAEKKFGFFEEGQKAEAKFGFFEETSSATVANPNQEDPSAAKIAEPSDQDKKKDLKISTEKLDQLMDLMGELVIAESNVVHHPELENLNLEGFRSAARHLHKIVRDIQEVAISTRMVPLTGVFQKMNRLARDLQKKSGKQVDLRIQGEETEVDKSVVETIQDPIIHLLRNAIDHGLEAPEERQEVGKGEKGILRLQARQSSNEVWILVSDDGKGLDREKILLKARTKGLIQGTGEDLSDREVYQLIFTPGFSTAEKVTDISGRGVGMDIVLQNLKKIGGKVDIRSRKGEGTTFVLRIPLTLGIIEGTVFEVGGTYLTLPTVEISELVDTKGKHIIRPYMESEVLDLRGAYIPMIRINDLLELRSPLAYGNANPILIILENDGRYLGILVDQVIGNQNIVVKPLTQSLQAAKGVNGFTILGNGLVSLIIDTKYLFEKFHRPVSFTGNAGRVVAGS